MSPRAQQVAYIVTVLAVGVALIVAVFAEPKAGSAARLDGVSGSPKP